MEGSTQEKAVANKSKPNAWYRGKKIETNALGVNARLNYSNLALGLIQDTASLIATKSMVRFVPMSLKFNKMTKDNAEKDFQVGGIPEEMLEQEVWESTAKENVVMSLFMADIHKTRFAINKGIWTIETTVEDLHKALADVKTLLEVLPDVLDVEYFNKFEAFPAPWVIPTYDTTYKYTE
eukprot:8149625-Ditylum_brightwellii.AAC.1